MRNETKSAELRLDAARSAAPYVHPRFASINSRITGEEIVTVLGGEPIGEEEWESQHCRSPA